MFFIKTQVSKCATRLRYRHGFEAQKCEVYSSVDRICRIAVLIASATSAFPGSSSLTLDKYRCAAAIMPPFHAALAARRRGSVFVASSAATAS